MKRFILAALGAAAFLTACGDAEGPGGVSAEEERQLDEAARMLDDNMIDVSPDSLALNEAELEALDSAEGGGTNSAEGNGL